MGTVADSNQPAGHFFSDNWIALLLGGSLLEGVYATFWFTINFPKSLPILRYLERCPDKMKGIDRTWMIRGWIIRNLEQLRKLIF